MTKRGKPRLEKTTKQRRREARAGRQRTSFTDQNRAQDVAPTPTYPVISDLAGLTALSRSKRGEHLRGLDKLSTLYALASIQSRLDVATTTDWSEGRVEQELLAESSHREWTSRLMPMVGSTHRLIPPRSMTQLIREVLEVDGNSALSARTEIDIADVLELIMSITTEQASAQNPLDAIANPDASQVSAQIAAIAAYTLEESVAAIHQFAVDEMANLQSNEAVKIELIKASTYDLWFRPWPVRATDARIGPNPAIAFELANGVPLLDVMVVGQIITDGLLVGEMEFTSQGLVDAGATTAAVEFVVQNMALSPDSFSNRLRRDRSRGPVADQRYVFTERPFLLRGAGTLLALRYQWVIDRFFGSQLYWQTFFAFGPVNPGSVSESFSQAMNYAFERIVGDSLERISAHSAKFTRLVTETEMQAEWTPRRGRPPSVCDFMLIAGRACILIDATNHHLSANLAQGLAGVDAFNDDIESSFVVTKFEQIVSTAKHVREHLSFGVEADPIFYPYVVVPNNGLSNTTAVQLDWRSRAAGPFDELQGSTRPPVPLRIGDLALFEGLAEFLSTPARDIADLFGGWTSEEFPVSLRQLLEKYNLPAPIPRRMTDDQKALDQLIRERRNPSHG